MRALILCGLIALITSCGGGGAPVIDPPPVIDDQPIVGSVWHLTSTAPADLPASWDMQLVQTGPTAWAVYLPAEILAHVPDPLIARDGLFMRKGDDSYYSQDIFAGDVKPHRYLSVLIYDDRTECIVRYPDGSGGAVEVTYGVTDMP